MKIKIKTEPNLLIALGVLITSFASLFVCISQTSIMSKQNQILMQQTKASAWPSLSIHTWNTGNTSGLNGFKIKLTNKGTGPAIIQKVIIKHDGKAVKNWKEFYTEIKIPQNIPHSHTISKLSNQIISANEEFELIDWSSSKKMMQYIYNHADKISIEIYYRSVFNEFWVVKREGFNSGLSGSEKNTQTKIEESTIPNAVFFEE